MGSRETMRRSGVHGKKKSPSPHRRKLDYQGTVKGPSSEDFDPEKAAQALRKAFRGLGTDEKVVINVIASHTNQQRQEIKKKYKTMYGRDLVGDLEDELGGHFLDTSLALFCPSHLYDAHCLRKAMAGAGTDDECLIEILCSRSNSEIELIKEAYFREFGRKLEDDLQSETSSDFGRLLCSLAAAGRNEDAELDQKLAEKDAAKLQAAGIDKIGTETSIFHQILCLRSGLQLKLTMEMYKKRTGKDLEQDIRKEFSGDLRRSLSSIIKVMKNPVGYFAEKIHDCLKGPGTDDDALVRLLVSRSEVDLAQIKEEFQRLYKKTLVKAVREDCSGDYCRLLCKLLA